MPAERERVALARFLAGATLADPAPVSGQRPRTPHPGAPQGPRSPRPRGRRVARRPARAAQGASGGAHDARLSGGLTTVTCSFSLREALTRAPAPPGLSCFGA
jgi:hypothetical protein